MFWWQTAPDRLAREKTVIRRMYPDWKFYYDDPAGVWRGAIQPLPPGSDVQDVLACIKAGVDLNVGLNGSLSPTEHTSRSMPSWVRTVGDLSTTFEIVAWYREPPGMPFAVSVSPWIPGTSTVNTPTWDLTSASANSGRGKSPHYARAVTRRNTGHGTGIPWLTFFIRFPSGW